MFKFNFSSDTEPAGSVFSEESVDKNTKDGRWADAAELNLKLTLNPKFSDDVSSWREIIFNNCNVKLLKREVALTNIVQDVNSPQFTIEAEKNNSDLQSTKYEGGLKVWECSEDLAEFIIKNLGFEKLTGKNVLDLGCGSGVIGIVALQLGANSVTFQDYNQEVLTHWTCPNVSLNLPLSNGNEDLNTKCKFWSGDWGSFSEMCTDKFDYIFTSETIYNPDNYDKLKLIFSKQTIATSTILLAAKSVYFSLGGSVQLFTSHLNNTSKCFDTKEVFKTDDGVQRVIVDIKPIT